MTLHSANKQSKNKCYVFKLLKTPASCISSEYRYINGTHNDQVWRRSAPELWGPHDLEEGKGQGYLASSRQYEWLWRRRLRICEIDNCSLEQK